MVWSDWGALARRQSGVVSRAQLVGLGCTNRQVDALIARGDLRRAAAGVFLARGAPPGSRAALFTAVLATGGTVGFRSATALWGMTSEAADVHIVVPRDRHVVAPSRVRLHRVVIPARQTTVLDGLPVTSRPWSVKDQLSTLSIPAATRLADRAFQQGWLHPAALVARLRDHPGRTGNPTLRAVLVGCAEGAAAESERLLHRLLRRAGIRGWRANHGVERNGQLVAIADVAFPQARLVVEVDGWAFHSDVERFRRDRHRQNALVALGWVVLRFSWADVTERPDYVVATVRTQLRRAT